MPPGAQLSSRAKWTFWLTILGIVLVIYLSRSAPGTPGSDLPSFVTEFGASSIFLFYAVLAIVALGTLLLLARVLWYLGEYLRVLSRRP